MATAITSRVTIDVRGLTSLAQTGRPMAVTPIGLTNRVSIKPSVTGLACACGDMAIPLIQGGRWGQAMRGERWSPFFGQAVKLGSPDEKDGPDDGQAEAVWG